MDLLSISTPTGSIDIKDVVGGWGKATPSLNEIATLSGIPGKMDVDGEKVAFLWLDGKLNEIVAYNEFDALTTYLVWLRVAHFGGHFTGEEYEVEQQLVRELISSEIENGKIHLKKYLEEWDHAVATHSVTAKSVLSKLHFPFLSAVVETLARWSLYELLCENKHLPQTPAIREDSHV